MCYAYLTPVAKECPYPGLPSIGVAPVVKSVNARPVVAREPKLPRKRWAIAVSRRLANRHKLPLSADPLSN